MGASVTNKIVEIIEGALIGNGRDCDYVAADAADILEALSAQGFEVLPRGPNEVTQEPEA